MENVRVAVVGAGAFGRNHLRVLRDLPGVKLSGLVETDEAKAEAASRDFQVPAVPLSELSTIADAAIVASPTVTHADIGCSLLEAGVDVLVEKPLAHDLLGARRLVETAAATKRVLQVGHLERFNPVIRSLESITTLPLFFEIHRMSVFSPRSLDVDVVLDLMVHDIDIVLRLARAMPEEVRAAGVSILSEKVDIANVRLAFPNGCVANLTASRVSTEKVRKLRMFQPHQYVSVDYSTQKGVVFTVGEGRQIGMKQLDAPHDEPLKAELISFLDCVRTRQEPQVTGIQGLEALQVALVILDKIEEHSRIVRHTLADHWKSEWPGPSIAPARN